MSPVLSHEDDLEDGRPHPVTLSSLEKCADRFGQDPDSFIVFCMNEEVHVAGTVPTGLAEVPASTRHRVPWPSYTLEEIVKLAERALPGQDHDHIGIKARFLPDIHAYRPTFEIVS